MTDKEGKKAAKDEKKSKRSKEDKDPKNKPEPKSKDGKKEKAKDSDKKKDKSGKCSEASSKGLKESSRPASGKDNKSEKANGSSQSAAKRPEPKPRQLPPPVKQATENYLGDMDLPSSEDEEEYETSTRVNDEEEREFKPQVLIVSPIYAARHLPPYIWSACSAHGGALPFVMGHMHNAVCDSDISTAKIRHCNSEIVSL